MIRQSLRCQKTPAVPRGRGGFTLLEMAIVLAVAGLVFGAIWSVVASVWSAYQYRSMNEQLMTVTQNVRNYFEPMGGIYQVPATQTPFANGASITAFLDADTRRLIPVSMRTAHNVAGSRIHHALSARAVSGVDGSFSVYSLNNGNSFEILLAGLGRSDCMKMLLEFPFLTPEVGVTAVIVNGVNHAINPLNIAAPGAGFPMTATVARAWCNAAGKVNGVGLVFALRN
ncbi:MAG: prepilin-type N-terminal cleavage/methylation domain-containing protein [Alphaproteobacteria bacterium]|nr:prepilin-type N-terminal cleavage/methylation domain-containing protein [Alphaproteobacteria bacterium]